MIHHECKLSALNCRNINKSALILVGRNLYLKPLMGGNNSSNPLKISMETYQFMEMTNPTEIFKNAD